MEKKTLPDGWKLEEIGGWHNPQFGTVWREYTGKYWGIVASGKEIGPFKNLTEAISAVEAQCKQEGK
jgi:hypothetical protein